MRRKGSGNGYKYLLAGLLLAGWIAAYITMPRQSRLDGPFYTEPFGFDASTLPFLSKTDLEVFGYTLFVLESRENHGPAPGTVFVLKNRDGRILWTRLGAPELGRIRLEKRSARWFLPGGWVIDIKPEYTGSGEIYVSPLGNFRFFYHRW